MSETAYDRIGIGYGSARRADPAIAARIDAALGDAQTVLNVGAGTGSYEPTGRSVTAVEPSATMIDQRPVGAARAPTSTSGVRDGTSVFDRLLDAEVSAAMERLQRDLDDGSWDERNGGLRELSELDVGLRLGLLRTSGGTR